MCVYVCVCVSSPQADGKLIISSSIMQETEKSGGVPAAWYTGVHAVAQAKEYFGCERLQYIDLEPR